MLNAKPAGRLAGAGTYYVCAPLPAIGEIPDIPSIQDVGDGDAASEPDRGDQVGVI